jgi:hemolysin activation/secretion protein
MTFWPPLYVTGNYACSKTPVQCRLVALALAMSFSGLAQAQAPQASDPPMPTASQDLRFLIRGFDVQGENPLSPGETTRVLASFLRSDATLEVLQKATAKLEEALRDKGFGLYRVALPPQELGETVRLDIVRFVLGKISIEGQGDYSTDNIRMGLPDLKENGTPNFRTLAVQTAMVNENPGKNVTVSLKESEEADKVDAVIQVRPSRPWSLGVSANNMGTAATGRDRITLTAGHNNLLDRDHQFSVAYTTSATRTRDVKQLGLSYRLPVYSSRTMVGISYTQSDVVGSFGSFTSTGVGKTMGLNASYYLTPNGAYKSYITASYDDKFYEGTQLNGIAIAQDTRSRSATLGYTGKYESESSGWSYSTEIAGHLPGGNGNSFNAYTNGLTNTEILNYHWTALRLNGQYSRMLESKWSWGGKFSSQMTRETLIAGEQFGIGGSSSVRGTSERAVAGDSGMFVNLEISAPEFAEGLRALAFFDAGRVKNNFPNGTTKLKYDYLSSFGVGLRYVPNRNLSVNLDYARLTKGSSVPQSISSSSPEKGDDKLHISVSWNY